MTFVSGNLMKEKKLKNLYIIYRVGFGSLSTLLDRNILLINTFM